MVGSDGYLYQGRGWHWVGAHTRGHNTKGYGVGYVGNFSATLPDPDAIALVRDGLLPCAVRAGRLRHDYALRGHRQVVNTSCPGDSLFQEIRTWRGFQVGTGSRGIHRGWGFGWSEPTEVGAGSVPGLPVGSALLRSEDRPPRALRWGGAGPDGCWSRWVLVRMGAAKVGSWSGRMEA